MIAARTADECDFGSRDRKRSARRNGKRQPAQAGPIRRQLFLRPRGHYGSGALVRELARLRQAGADGRPGRHRVHAADRALEGLWRRHRLPGCDVGDGCLGLRALGQNRAARCVWNRACAADPATDCRQGVCHRRPHRRRSLRSHSCAAGTRASSRCSARHCAITRRATTTRRNGSISSNWPGLRARISSYSRHRSYRPSFSVCNA